VNAAAWPVAAKVARKGSHKRCARCAKVVSARALVCRRCGKKQRLNPKVSLLVVAGVFLAGLFAVASAGPRLPFGRKDVASVAWSAPARPAEAAYGEVAARLTASELWEQYNLDAHKADARFRDKPLAISGVVRDVRKDFRGNVMLRLGTGDALETVRATLINRDDRVGVAPTRGQTVALRCTGRGALIGAPVLDSCVAL
jgi:hypothetical protein